MYRTLSSCLSALSLLLLAAAGAGCSDSGLSDRRAGVLPPDVHGARANWVDEDTHGVGTHRITADAVNVRSDALDDVSFVADSGDQLVITGETRERSGYTYQQAVFKGGDVEGQYGWVATDFLAHTVLRVCGDQVAVRGDGLDTVQSRADRGDIAYVVSKTIRNTGQHRYFKVSVNGSVGFVATGFLCPESANDGTRVGIANALLDHHDAGEMYLWEDNFGRSDGASAFDNVADAAAGLPSLHSCDGNAPCGSVYLDRDMLDAMDTLVNDYGFDYFVTSIAGASHSVGSLHYQGRAVDIGEVNGRTIYGDSPEAQALMNACWALGAIEVFGPSNDPYGHYTHVHCAW